jgi:hypothetical protein
VRKRIAALVATTLAVGIATVLPVVTATQAQAYPATGTHTIVSTCNYTAGGVPKTKKTEVNYTISFVASHGAPKFYNEYLFALNYVEYNGPNVVGRTPDVKVEIKGDGASFHSATGKPETSNPYVFGYNEAVAPTTTKVNGLAGVDWDPFIIKMSNTGRDWNNRMAVIQADAGTGQTQCPIQYWDLSLPYQVQSTNSGYAQLTCAGGLNAPNGVMSLEYSINVINSSTYIVQVTHASFSQDNPTTGDYFPTLSLDLLSGDDQYSLSPPGGMATGTRSGISNFPNDDSGPFPEVTAEYIIGEGTKPQIKMIAHSSGPVDCVRTWDLTEVWGVAGHSYTNTAVTEFNDCSSNPQPAGRLEIKSFWEWDANDEKVRFKSVEVKNQSNARIYMKPLKPNTFLPSPVYRSDAPGGPSYLGSTLSASNSDRYFNANTTRTFASPGKPAQWEAVTAYQTTAPTFLVLPVVDVPVLEMSFEAQTPNGTGWTLCTATGAQLHSLEATSLRL